MIHVPCCSSTTTAREVLFLINDSCGKTEDIKKVLGFFFFFGGWWLIVANIKLLQRIFSYGSLFNKVKNSFFIRLYF